MSQFPNLNDDITRRFIKYALIWGTAVLLTTIILT